MKDQTEPASEDKGRSLQLPKRGNNPSNVPALLLLLLLLATVPEEEEEVPATLVAPAGIAGIVVMGMVDDDPEELRYDPAASSNRRTRTDETPHRAGATNATDHVYMEIFAGTLAKRLPVFGSNKRAVKLREGRKFAP